MKYELFKKKIWRFEFWNSIEYWVFIIEKTLVNNAWKNICLGQCLTTSRGKFMKKKIRAQNQVFCHFVKFASLVFHNSAQDFSWGQYLTSSRAETSKKKKSTLIIRARKSVFQHFLSDFVKGGRIYQIIFSYQLIT